MRGMGWHGVEARRAERTAAQEATHGEPQTAARPVDMDRLGTVFGTRREEPARRRPTVDSPLVAVDQAKHQALRRGVLRKIDVTVVDG